ncbi:FT-interacting protein 3, partial [Cucurbita argyrosperma subsp. sororia]
MVVGHLSRSELPLRREIILFMLNAESHGFSMRKIGANCAWNYKFRSRGLLPHFDSKLSMSDTVEMDELDEEFDGMSSTRSLEVVRMRYVKLRAIGVRVQHLLGDLATQAEQRNVEQRKKSAAPH